MTTWKARVNRAAADLPIEPLVSPWREVTQQALDQYAESIDDPDPMHVDPAWARAHTPFGGTVAPGLWAASLLVRMLHQTGLTDRIQQALGVEWGLNYGFDRLRFVRPLPVGARVRGRFTPRSLVPRGEAQAIATLDVVIEREGSAEPIVAGEWKVAFVAAEST